jgi:hypothetical protein
MCRAITSDSQNKQGICALYGDNKQAAQYPPKITHRIHAFIRDAVDVRSDQRDCTDISEQKEEKETKIPGTKDGLRRNI